MKNAASSLILRTEEIVDFGNIFPETIMKVSVFWLRVVSEYGCDEDRHAGLVVILLNVAVVLFFLVLILGFASVASSTTWVCLFDLPFHLHPECPVLRFKLVPHSSCFLTFFQVVFFCGTYLLGKWSRKAP